PPAASFHRLPAADRSADIPRPSAVHRYWHQRSRPCADRPGHAGARHPTRYAINCGDHFPGCCRDPAPDHHDCDTAPCPRPASAHRTGNPAEWFYRNPTRPRSPALHRDRDQNPRHPHLCRVHRVCEPPEPEAAVSLLPATPVLPESWVGLLFFGCCVLPLTAIVGV